MPRKRFVFYTLMLACLSLWLFISAPYLIWFLKFLPLHFDLLHALVALLVLGISIHKLKIKPFRAPPMVIDPLALVFCVVGLAGLLFIRTQASIRIFGFSASLVLLYGLLNPVLGTRTWNRGIFPFILLLMTLPFGRHIDVFVGYPLRMGIVSLVNSSLQPFFPGLESYSGILVMENRASYIDMDCSGLRGLWVSWLIFLTLSWMEGIGKKLSWFMGFLLFSSWILLGNFIRVFLLVLIHTIWNKPGLDPLVHQSTSLFFLLSACYFAFLWLRRRSMEQKVPMVDLPKMSALIPLFTVLCGMIFVSFTPVYASRIAEHQDLSPLKHTMKTSGWKELNLTRTEMQVFSREAVQSLKFGKDSLEVLLVFDGDWNSQHKPELCYESSGIRLKAFRTCIIQPGLSIREIQFESQKAKAFYWFQQGALSTSDFGEKVWTQVRGGNQKWTMISILSKSGQLPSREISALYSQLKTLSSHE